MKSSKKKSEHYVDNKKFFDELVLYKKQLKEWEENGKTLGKPKPRVNNYIGECFLKIARKFSSKGNYVNYSYKEEMISDGIENCIRYIHNFDPFYVNPKTQRKENPFAYFTQIVYYAFLRRIDKEKRQLELQEKIKERTGFEEVMMVDENFMQNGNSQYNSIKDSIYYKKSRLN